MEEIKNVGEMEKKDGALPDPMTKEQFNRIMDTINNFDPIGAEYDLYRTVYTDCTKVVQEVTAKICSKDYDVFGNHSEFFREQIDYLDDVVDTLVKMRDSEDLKCPEEWAKAVKSVNDTFTFLADVINKDREVLAIRRLMMR